MSAQSYQQLIVEGIKGLPEDLLAEIADFVYFVRKRALDKGGFEQELGVLREFELAHLEEEFANYEQRYPRE